MMTSGGDRQHLWRQIITHAAGGELIREEMERLFDEAQWPNGVALYRLIEEPDGQETYLATPETAEHFGAYVKTWDLIVDPEEHVWTAAFEGSVDLTRLKMLAWA